MRDRTTHDVGDVGGQMLKLDPINGQAAILLLQNVTNLIANQQYVVSVYLQNINSEQFFSIAILTFTDAKIVVPNVTLSVLDVNQQVISYIEDESETVRCCRYLRVIPESSETRARPNGNTSLHLSHHLALL